MARFGLNEDNVDVEALKEAAVERRETLIPSVMAGRLPLQRARLNPRESRSSLVGQEFPETEEYRSSVSRPAVGRGLEGALLGALGALLESMWRISPKEGRCLITPAPLEPQNRLLAPSWSALGALLGALGAVLEPSWAPLGALLGHLGAILRLRIAIGSEKARRPTTLIFFSFFQDVGFSGAT